MCMWESFRKFPFLRMVWEVTCHRPPKETGPEVIHTAWLNCLSSHPHPQNVLTNLSSKIRFKSQNDFVVILQPTFRKAVFPQNEVRSRWFGKTCLYRSHTYLILGGLGGTYGDHFPQIEFPKGFALLFSLLFSPALDVIGA